MNKSVQPYVMPFLRRFLFLSILSAGLVLLFSELAYRLLREDISRGPMTIELVIPKGTANRVALGEAEPTIPEEMVFVTGDILVVHNEDDQDHQLGPLWIPANSGASLKMDEASDYAYTCSFRPSNYFGITVRQPVGLKERTGALIYGTPSTVMFLLVYSFVVKPLKPDQPKKRGGEAVE
jgi:hypothetical protein